MLFYNPEKNASQTSIKILSRTTVFNIDNQAY